jgi:hypothetical protein
MPGGGTRRPGDFLGEPGRWNRAKGPRASFRHTPNLTYHTPTTPPSQTGAMEGGGDDKAAAAAAAGAGENAAALEKKE